MGNFIINVIGVFLLIIIVWSIYMKLHPHAFDRMLEKQMRKNAQILKKEDKDMHGKRYSFRREDGTLIKANLYFPDSNNEKMPAVFIAHGGNFMDGSADQIDTFCDRMKDEWGAAVISIDYTLITERQFPYQQDEIKDTVLWFARHSSEFKLDPSRFVLAGFSAGAYLMTGAGSILKGYKFNPAGLIVCYPIIDEAMIRLADAGVHPSPVSIIECGKNSSAEQMNAYCEHLESHGMNYELQTYADAYSGFIEANNPEYTANSKLNRSPAISEEQENMARAAEIWMGGQLRRFFEQNNGKK